MGHHQLKKDEATDLARFVVLAQRKDQAAFTEVILRTKNSLFRFLVYLGANNELANDLCQDAYLYCLENFPSLKEPEAFTKWLFTIAKNKLLDHRRSPKNRPAGQPYENAASFPSGGRELHLQVVSALQQLGEEDRLAILLVDLEGYTYAETSDIMGVSEAAVVSRIHRARRRFHELFSR